MLACSLLHRDLTDPMDFLLGTLIIVLPNNQAVPLLLGGTAIKAIGGLLEGKKNRRRVLLSAPGAGRVMNNVTLRWSQLTCTLNGARTKSCTVIRRIKSGKCVPETPAPRHLFFVCLAEH